MQAKALPHTSKAEMLYHTVLINTDTHWHFQPHKHPAPQVRQLHCTALRKLLHCAAQETVALQDTHKADVLHTFDKTATLQVTHKTAALNGAAAALKALEVSKTAA